MAFDLDDFYSIVFKVGNFHGRFSLRFAGFTFGAQDALPLIYTVSEKKQTVFIQFFDLSCFLFFQVLSAEKKERFFSYIVKSEQLFRYS